MARTIDEFEKKILEFPRQRMYYLERQRDLEKIQKLDALKELAAAKERNQAAN